MVHEKAGRRTWEALVLGMSVGITTGSLVRMVDDGATTARLCFLGLGVGLFLLFVALYRRREREEDPGPHDGPTSTWVRRGDDHDSRINHHRGGRHTMNTPSAIAITPVFVADLHVEGERMPIYVHVIDHPDARVLVDTGMTELHPLMADMDPRLRPLSEQDLDLAGIDIVVNTHLHADHCGGNHLFAGRPIYVQRRELDDARSEDDYTIREWVDAPGVRYEPVDGELELLPGVRLVPAPGHTPGTQVVVVETGSRPIVIGGDMAVWFGELDEPHTEGQLLVRALDPEMVWLAHEHEPWRPPTG
jgi:N-acyl homoserine lactone hydrolase